MHVFSDYLFSIIIAGVVLLIALSLKFQGEETTIDATQFRAAKVSAHSLIDVMERDFNNIGAQFMPNTHLNLKPEDALEAHDTLSTPAAFQFFAQTDSTQPAQLITYEWRPSGRSVNLKRGSVPLLNVTRKVGNPGTLSGRSNNMITNLEIHLLRADSTGITNLKGPGADTQQILIRLTAVSPLGAGDALEEIRWEKVFRPANLWKRRDI